MGRDSHAEPVAAVIDGEAVSPNAKFKGVLAQAQPWDQQPGEGLRAYAGFRCFMSMPLATRSIEAVGKELGVNPKTVKQWRRDWRWSGRLVAYERHLVAVQQKAAETRLVISATDWAARANQIREAEFETAKEALEICRRMINKIGKALNHRKTVSINQIANVAKLLDIASKVGRLASGLDTERTANTTEISGPGGSPLQVEVAAAIAKVYGEDPSKAIDAEEIKPLSIPNASNKMDTPKLDAPCLDNPCPTQ